MRELYQQLDVAVIDVPVGYETDQRAELIAARVTATGVVVTGQPAAHHPPDRPRKTATCSTSGKLDEGEDLEAALIRETREEIGLHLRRDAVRMVTSVHYRNPEGQARVGFFFHVPAWSGEPYNAEPDKCARIGWFLMNQLPDSTAPPG